MLEDDLRACILICTVVWLHHCNTDGFEDSAMIALTLASGHDSGSYVVVM